MKKCNGNKHKVKFPKSMIMNFEMKLTIQYKLDENKKNATYAYLFTYQSTKSKAKM
jgi:hypothetical protein